MTTKNLTVKDVADLLDAWSEYESRRAPYLSSHEKTAARNREQNFAWLRDELRASLAGKRETA